MKLSPDHDLSIASLAVLGQVFSTRAKPWSDYHRLNPEDFTYNAFRDGQIIVTPKNTPARTNTLSVGGFFTRPPVFSINTKKQVVAIGATQHEIPAVVTHSPEYKQISEFRLKELRR